MVLESSNPSFIVLQAQIMSSNFTWPNTTDLIGIQLTITPSKNYTLPSNYTYWLHAWFLDQIRQVDPNLSAYLHANQDEKAFTLSAFLGDTQESDRAITFSPSKIYHCQITALSAALSKALKQWLIHPPTKIQFRDGTFQITDWKITHPPITYEAIWDNPKRSDLSLTFLSPTGFRKNGNHMPLPIPENIFHSYLRRWNIFAHIEYDQEEFLRWVNECVVIQRHDIRSHKAQPGKQGSVTGFIGNLQLGLTPKAKTDPEYIHLIHALIQTAPYFATGHKVTFGLGQTRLGWLTLPVASLPTVTTLTNEPTLAIPNATHLREIWIKTRIKELEPIFFEMRKRQGGNRARNTAHLWATIIARQESGDSLSAISDLERLIKLSGGAPNCIIDLTGMPKGASIDVFTVCFALGIKSIYTFELKKRFDPKMPDQSLYHSLTDDSYSYTCLTATPPVQASQASLLRKSYLLWYIGSLALVIMLASLYILVSIGPNSSFVQYLNLAAAVVGLASPGLALLEQRRKG
jgi:CRISPR-associated endoribonuclease Cas6